MSGNNGHTPIQGRIMGLLRDGKPHSRDDLLQCLQDPEASYNALALHLSRMRKLLRLKGQDVLCEMVGGGIYYRLVRLLGNPYK